MKFEFDSEFLLKNNITPNQFFVLQLASEKRNNYLGRYEEFMKEDIDKLVEKGYIKKIGKRYRVTPMYLEEVEEKGSFQELLETFPKSVVRKDGILTYLRKDRIRSAKLYEKKTRNRKDVHDYIIECLKFEVQERTKDGTIIWMKTLPNWLEAEEWVEWGERKKDCNRSGILETQRRPYGTEIE